MDIQLAEAFDADLAVVVGKRVEVRFVLAPVVTRLPDLGQTFDVC